MLKDKIILLYGIKNDRLEVIKRVAFAHGFEIREVKEDQLNCRVSNLIEDSKCSSDEFKVKDFSFDEDFEYMLFVNIHDELLYNFLSEIKKEGVYIPHKAVLTETNKKWPLSYLMNENKEEHKVMSLYGQLRKAISVADGLLEKTKDTQLKEVLDRAQDYLQPREFEFEELRDVYNTLAQRINDLLSQNR